jgi:hypothetical protein
MKRREWVLSPTVAPVVVLVEERKVAAARGARRFENTRTPSELIAPPLSALADPPETPGVAAIRTA